MSRLVLSTVGIKSPVDVRPDPRAGGWRKPVRGSRHSHLRAVPESPGPRGLPRSKRRSLTPRPVISDASSSRSETTGPVTTTLSLDHRLAQKIDATARAAGVSAEVLAVAALTAGMPSETSAARRMIADQATEATKRCVKRHLTLPEDLRRRADDLAIEIRQMSPGTCGSDVVDAALRKGLPATPQLALALVIVTAGAS